MASRKLVPLKASALYRSCSLSRLAFKTTADLKPLDRPLGQERALESIEFGVDIEQQGFNLFMIGDPGLGKHELIHQILSQQAKREDARFDWCYVNNFDNPQQPRVLKLPAGMGQKMRQDMESLVEDLLTALPSSFQSEEYQNRRQEIDQELQERQEQAFRKLGVEAEAEGITIMRTPGGYTLGPMRDGRPLDQQEYEQLAAEEKQRIEKLIADLQMRLQEIIRDMPLLQREHHQRIKALNREITQHTVEQLIAWMENSYREYPEIMEYLQAVKDNAIKDVDAFLPSDRVPESDNIAARVAAFHAYSINVIVDNTENEGAPIVFEDNPTYQNLIGRIEYLSQMGTLVTNFTLIKPGALHRANGGYLIIDALKLLRHGFAWEGLKRALKAGEIKIQSLEQMLSLANTVSLEPESIPVKVKVVLSGEPELYYLLMAYDPDFGQLFKVSADFSRTTRRSPENVAFYARLIASIQSNNDSRPLDRASVGRVIEEASRAVGDADKLSLYIGELRDLLSEADYWAEKAGSKVIRLADIERAIGKREYRRDKYRELMQEQIMRGIKLIDTGGERIGQVNALAVLQTGDYRFGQASRITATARLGRRGVVDIERESKLGGDIHSKGVMILSSYLANRYAANQPLPLAASLAFEQSYGMVDGDSASAAELCALLSALGEIPLKQSLAVTGSINQLGEIQAIGGVNEKIEGFFDICQARGLSGEQGVIVPAANRPHLMLHEKVRSAAAEGRFHVYTAQTVDDVMQLLSGLPPGKLNARGSYPSQSFNNRVQQRIENLQNLQKQFARRGGDTPANPDKKAKS